MSSKPIPISKSPRDTPTRVGGAASSRISKSMPAVPASPHFGSLKAPPEFLTTMPPLELPTSIPQQPIDALAQSAPAADLAPLHRYRLDEQKQQAVAGSVTAATGKSLSSSMQQHGMSRSLLTQMTALSIEETNESDEVETPQFEDKKSVVLAGLMGTNRDAPLSGGVTGGALGEEEEDDEDVEVSSDDELQFELS